MSTKIRPGTTARHAVGIATSHQPHTRVRGNRSFRRGLAAACTLGVAAAVLSVVTGAATVSSAEDPPSLSQHLYSGGGPVNGWQ